MAESNQSVYWNDQPSQSSSQGYLDEQYILNNFSLSQQGGDVASGSSNSMLPIGLKLKQDPSLLEMLQTNVANEKSKNSERVKAGNFPATSIKIGNWERCSRQEGDLTAKIYYARHKLVWEVLEGAVKYKIEIQWSNISSIRAILHENRPGTLEVELSQPPLFFREVTSVTRKHTLWEHTSDFTGGHALFWRRHIVSSKPGILDKYYERLLQCNQRIFEMSMKPFPSHECSYFDTTFGNSNMSLTDSPLSLSLNSSISAMNMAYNNDAGNMNSNNNMTYQPQFTLWDQDSSHNNQVYEQQAQYPNHYQPPHVERQNDTGNYLLGDQSGVSSSHQHLGIVPHNEGALSEVTNMINPSYDYPNYASAGYQYQYAPVTYGSYSNNALAQQYSDNNLVTDYTPATYGFCSDNVQAPQYSVNNGVTNYSHVTGVLYPDNAQTQEQSASNRVMNYQGSTSLSPYYNPDYNPYSDDLSRQDHIVRGRDSS